MTTLVVPLGLRITSPLLFIFLALVTSALAAPAAKGQTLMLVDAGKANSVIVLPSSTLRSEHSFLNIAEQDAARILQEHIHQMSGAELPIMREDELGITAVRDGRLACEDIRFVNKNFVLVGEGALCGRLGVSSRALGPGGMLSTSLGNVLVLIGHPFVSHPQLDGGGVRAAVISFLEYLGFRYLWPGEVGKVVPIRKTIAVGPVFKEFTPPIGQRKIRWLGMTDRMKRGIEYLELDESAWHAGHNKALTTKSPVSWSVWNGLGGDLKLQGGHAFGWLWDRFGKEHPEWFALQADGTQDQSRVSGGRVRLCKSNTHLIDAISNHIIEKIKSTPGTVSFSLAPNDGGYSSFCMCDSCKALDPRNAPKVKLLAFERVGEPQRKVLEYPALTDRMVFFWNSIIERVTKVYPHLLFVIDAYSAYQNPPLERRIHPNAVLRYVPSNADNLDGWLKMGISKVIWRPNILESEKRSGTLSIIGRTISRNIQQMMRGQLLAVDFDSILDHWSVHGLNYYVAARLSWNPTLEYDDILYDYCLSGFGPAAEQIKQYFLAAEAATSNGEVRCLSKRVIDRLRNLLHEAEQLVQGDEAITARVWFLRGGLEFTAVQVLLDALADRASKGDPTLDMNEAARLLGENFSMLREIVINDNLIVNAAYLAWATGNFAKWRSLGWPERFKHRAN